MWRGSRTEATFPMVLQRWLHAERFGFFCGVVILIAAGCVCAPRALGQADAAAGSSNPILSAEVDDLNRALVRTGIKPEAFELYRRAVEELHGGKSAAAEKDALRAVAADGKFADADALAATAALTQRQFARALTEANAAVHIDANDEKAWVILATADNHLAQYSDALAALSHVREEHRGTWQVAYQWARAEAGRNDAAETLDWANRAALTAPSDFAPLHLLRASALLAAGRRSQCADELEIYLQLLNRNAPERAGLMREMQRIRRLPATGQDGEYNALAN